MESSNEIFSEKVVDNIKKGDLSDILQGICSIKEDDTLILNYIYFRCIANVETYDHILNYITNNIEKVLLRNNEFNVHVNMKNLTLSDIDKHKSFFQYISIVLKEKYPKKLAKCYVYNAPFVFSQLYNVICMFIDKDTQKKIELVKK